MTNKITLIKKFNIIKVYFIIKETQITKYLSLKVQCFRTLYSINHLDQHNFKIKIKIFKPIYLAMSHHL